MRQPVRILGGSGDSGPVQDELRSLQCPLPGDKVAGIGPQAGAIRGDDYGTGGAGEPTEIRSGLVPGGRVLALVRIGARHDNRVEPLRLDTVAEP